MRLVPSAAVLAALLAASLPAFAQEAEPQPQPLDPKSLGLAFPTGIALDSAQRVDPTTVTLDLTLGDKPFHIVLRALDVAGTESLGGTWQTTIREKVRADVSCRTCTSTELERVKNAAISAADQGVRLVTAPPEAPRQAGSPTSGPGRDHTLPIPLLVIVSIAIAWALGLLGWRLSGFGSAISPVVAALVGIVTALVVVRTGTHDTHATVGLAGLAAAFVTFVAAGALGVRAGLVAAVGLLASSAARGALHEFHGALVVLLVAAALGAVWVALVQGGTANRLGAGLLVGALPWASSGLWPLVPALVAVVLLDERRGPVRAWVGPLVLAVAAAVPPALLAFRASAEPTTFAEAVVLLLGVPDARFLAGAAVLAIWLILPLFVRKDDPATEPFRLASVLSGVVAIGAALATSAPALQAAFVPLAFAAAVLASMRGSAAIPGTVAGLLLALSPVLAPLLPSAG